MSTDQHFNKDFDAELNAAMMAKYRASRHHCHWCGKEETAVAKLLFCSACQMAWYCSRKCQKKDWKQGEHKGFCHDFRHAQDKAKLAAPVPIMTMKNLGNVTLEEYESLIWDRLGLFAPEMTRLATVRGVVGLHLHAGALKHRVEGVYLNVGAIIPWPGSGNPLQASVDGICILLFLKIDEGQAAESQICQGSGRLSKAGKEKVLKYLRQTVAIFKEHTALFPMSITYGRGLMFITSDKAFRNKIQEAGNGFIMFVPSRNERSDDEDVPW